MMQEIFDKLRSLQEILSNKFEVENEIDDIPKALATKTELLNRLKITYIQKNNELADTKIKIKTTRQKMLDAETERENYEMHMDHIKTQREYEALDKEIKDATEKEQDFRVDLQNLQKSLEEMQENLGKEELMIEQQEEEVKTEQSRIKQKEKEKTKALQKFQKDESKITPGLDEEILFKFERIIRSKSGLGIVPVIDGVCTGCHMHMAAQFVNDIRMSAEIMFCPDCSRILFYSEEEEPAAFNMDFFDGEQADTDDEDYENAAAEDDALASTSDDE